VDALELAAKLKEKDIPFVAVSTCVPDGKLEEMADVHINLQLLKGLLPDDFGNRYGYPSSMAGLYVYYGLKFTIDEILAEYE
jgi:D-arabinose 5-phosphate isomerase GutQ